MSRVKIVEALCGCGKTHWAIAMMSNNKSDQWIFVTPFLDEAGECGGKDDLGNYGYPKSAKDCRVYSQAPGMDFRCPSENMKVEVRKGESLYDSIVRTSKLKNKAIDKRNMPNTSEIVKLNKSEHLLLLLLEGRNVSITHALLLNISKDVVDVIESNSIRIVIDETIEKIDVFSSDKTLVGDVINLIELGHISVKDNGQLSWDIQELSRYKEIYEMCVEGILYLYNNLLLVRKYSSFAYEVAKDVHVLTYMFEHSPMRVWMKACGIEWEYVDADLKVSTKQKKEQIRKLICIEKHESSLDIHKHNETRMYSSTWYKEAANGNQQAFKDMRTVATKLYKRWGKRLGNAPKVMYTTFLKYADDVAGTGSRRIDFREPSLVSKSARASNKHGDRDCLLYWVDVYPHMSLQMYLDSIVEKEDRLDVDKFAVSEMVQWVFRSAIRHGEPINIFIASPRMRRLFENWLDEDE